MTEFIPEKLNVFIDDKINNKNLTLPRRYTLTHSDTTGELFLSIGTEYDYKKFSSLYSRLLRDEVLGEWQNSAQISLDIYCLVSGGFALGPAKWRKSIFEYHMKMVLQAICYGDRSFIKENRDFLNAPVYVHFLARKKKLTDIVKWGTIRDFMPLL